MNSMLISDSQGFKADANLRQTFANTPTFNEISGPGVLVRLIQAGKTTYDGQELKASRVDGLFWFDEVLLRRLRQQARMELLAQSSSGKGAFAAPLSSLISLYVRHCLRSQLAICKDWTHDFDSYVRLPLRGDDKVTALVGPIRKQAAYSSTDPGHARAVQNNIWLEGQEEQYVIDFRFKGNESYVGRIQGPIPLG
jgi:hypothetical protein